MVTAKWLIRLSLIASLSCCAAFACASYMMYSDRDYVYNYLKCTASSDSVSIPIFGSFIIAAVFALIHLIYHSLYRLAKARKQEASICINPFDARQSRVVGVILKSAAIYLSVVFAGIYNRGYYKFYLTEFLFHVALVATLLLYSITLTDFIPLIFRRKSDNPSLT